jgi:hypothetical protein
MNHDWDCSMRCAEWHAYIRRTYTHSSLVVHERPYTPSKLNGGISSIKMKGFCRRKVVLYSNLASDILKKDLVCKKLLRQRGH